jgi:hypothetical protein
MCNINIVRIASVKKAAKCNHSNNTIKTIHIPGFVALPFLFQ